MQGWHTGHNIPGYMPESDVYHFEDLESALSSMSDELEDVADSFAQLLGEYGGDLDTAINEAMDHIDEEKEKLEDRAHIKDVDHWGSWSVLVPNAIGSQYDLGVHYWVARCVEEDCELIEEDER